LHNETVAQQDLRPENVMIDSNGTVKIVDFGSTQIAGIMEMHLASQAGQMPGTAQFTAPEYFLGESATPRSDLFSLAVIAYQMLTGKLPYGRQVAKCRNRAEQKRLRYEPVQAHRPEIAFWVDKAIRKALQPDPYKRYEDASELVYSLQRPDRAFLGRKPQPLIERKRHGKSPVD